MHPPLFPALVSVLVGRKGGIPAAAALILRVVRPQAFAGAHDGGQFHVEVPHVIGEDELGVRQGLFLVHHDFERRGGGHGPITDGHRSLRPHSLHGGLLDRLDQRIDVKRQMYHPSFLSP